MPELRLWRKGTGGGRGEGASRTRTKKERRNRRCSVARPVDPTATIYHAAVASIVLLVLCYASRREKSRRERLSLSFSRFLPLPPLSFSLSLFSFFSSRERRNQQPATSECVTCVPPASVSTSAHPPLPLSFLRCVIVLFFRPNRGWERRGRRGGTAK